MSKLADVTTTVTKSINNNKKLLIIIVASIIGIIIIVAYLYYYFNKKKKKKKKKIKRIKNIPDIMHLVPIIGRIFPVMVLKPLVFVIIQRN